MRIPQGLDYPIVEVGFESKKNCPLGVKEKNQQVRRRPLVEPAFRIKMNGSEDGRNRRNRSLRGMKKRGTGGRNHTVKSITQKPLSLKLLRLGLYHT
jgi:hypothetical protein